MFLFILALCVGLSCATSVAPVFRLEQPLPCKYIDPHNNNALTANGTILLASQGANAANCRYPYPVELNIAMSCVQRSGVWAWEPTDPQVDEVFVPVNVLADFCYSNFFSRGSILVPPSSNISVFRGIDGQPSFNSSAAGLIVAETYIFNYGYTLITVDNVTTIDGSHTPANPTTFAALYTADRFDMSNRTQFWQSFQPELPCQSLTLSYLFETDLVTVGPANATSYSVRAKVFNQCAYDVRLFVGIVGGVGGAIILASVVATIVWVISLVRDSKNQHLVQNKYANMEL